MLNIRRNVGRKSILWFWSAFFGILANNITRNITAIIAAMTRYGVISTVKSCSLRAKNSLSVNFALPSVSIGLSFACMKFIATYIPRSEPIGLKLCAKFSLRVAVCSVPIERIYGLQLVSRNDKPHVSTK